MGVLDTLEAATPIRRAVTMCVDGALQAEWDAANEALDVAARSDASSGSLALPAVTAAVNHLDDLRDRVQASEVTFLFERMPWTDKIALKAAHPPRDGNLPDAFNGYNVESYTRALIRASVVSVTGAGGDTVKKVPAKTWDSLLGSEARVGHKIQPGTLNTKQVDRLVRAAMQVNDGENAVPPSARSLLESQDSGASLAQPSPGTSPPSGSEAGSPPGSPKSSATKTARSKARSAGT